MTANSVHDAQPNAAASTPDPASGDAAEIAKFDAIAHRFWDPQGEFGTLHSLNPARLEFITERAVLRDARVADIGCGGGLLAESMARAGARVTAIDLAPSMIDVARLHAAGEGLAIDYRLVSAEALAAEAQDSFDVVTCMEMLEHVPDIDSTIAACAALAVPGGNLFFSTINRHPEAWVLLILGAEYIANILPKGTHDYERFIRPSELAAACRRAGLTVRSVRGMRYNPLTRTTSLSDNTRANYLVHAIRS